MRKFKISEKRDGYKYMNMARRARKYMEGNPALFVGADKMKKIEYKGRLKDRWSRQIGSNVEVRSRSDGAYHLVIEIAAN